MKKLLTGVLSVLLIGSAVTAQTPAPGASISLRSRQGTATPMRQGFTHTGGGNIDVAQPSADTLVVTMTGVAVAGPHPCKTSTASLHFDLSQSFEVSFDKPEVKKAKLTMECRVIGLLRSHAGGGSASIGPAHAAVSCGSAPVLDLGLPPRAVTGGENLSINDREGPVAVPVLPGQYALHQVFDVTACHPSSWKLCKAASAEFAPDPALDPLWISYWEPFHGAAKKDFGVQVTIKVVPE
jgi:hypothetical protein